MLSDNAPVVEALCGSAVVFAFPQMKHILIGLVAYEPAVVQCEMSIIIVENTLDILGTLPVIGMPFIESVDFFL